MKKCNKCYQIKPLNQFFKDNSKTDGYKHHCKECHKELRKGYKSHLKQKIYQKICDLKHPYIRKNKKEKLIKPVKLPQSFYNDVLFDLGLKQCSKCKRILPVSSYHKTYTDRNIYSPICKDCDKQRFNNLSDQSRQKIKQRKREWEELNPLNRSTRDAKRRALEYNAIHENYSNWIKEVKSHKKFTCYWCGQRFSTKLFTKDHIIPLSRGGTDTKDNLVASCSFCNTSKGAKMPYEFNLTLKQPLLFII